jgi:phosphatidylglycerol:prolipoprotein diacylglycerol transferase
MIDPVAIRVGPVDIRWYGLAYLAGICSAYGVLRRAVGRSWLPIPAEALSSLVSWLVVGVIVGGRLGYWLIYRRPAQPEPWREIVAFWHGGMSFHGGLTGVAIAAWLWAKKQRCPLPVLADQLARAAPYGLFSGRIANFINAELVGRPTDLPWAVVFPSETVGRHPSQLYEAVLEGPLLLLLVTTVWRRRPSPGYTAGAFLVAYGLFRFAVEFTRSPDVQIGFVLENWMTMGQALSIVTVLIGLMQCLLPLGAGKVAQPLLPH